MRHNGKDRGRLAAAVIADLPASGIYQVMFRLAKPLELRVGALGIVAFPAGFWVYTGSAKRALRKRVARHISRVKKRHWHIDYVLPPGEVVAVRAFPVGAANECAAHQRLARRFGEGPGGFGSSDCSCRSHLVYLGEKGLHITGFLSILLHRRARCQMSLDARSG
ncbi:MAG: GIY-YIG nuclease family protein [Planctomycetes bacterium]|nr:GIY-YIG nuclease family protein [Planctomycetota bacterium]